MLQVWHQPGLEQEQLQDLAHHLVVLGSDSQDKSEHVLVLAGALFEPHIGYIPLENYQMHIQNSVWCIQKMDLAMSIHFFDKGNELEFSQLFQLVLY